MIISFAALLLLLLLTRLNELCDVFLHLLRAKISQFFAVDDGKDVNK